MENVVIGMIVHSYKPVRGWLRVEVPFTAHRGINWVIVNVIL